MLRRSLVCFCLLASTLTGCSVFRPSCPCATYFAVITVDVVDQLNQPVDGATLTITNPQTGNEIAENRILNDPSLPKGIYRIVDDNSLHHVSKHGTPVRVVVEKAQMRTSADFIIGTDECRCHVQKLSGPDVITLTE